MFARCPGCHSNSASALALLRVAIVRPIFIARTNLPPWPLRSIRSKGDVLLFEGRYREAIDAYQRGLMLAPSSIQPGLAMAYNYLGEPERAISYADKAMRLSPHDPFFVNLYNSKAMAFGILQDYEVALLWFQRAEAEVPNNPLNGFIRSALLALAGREADARATMQRYLASENASIRTIAQWQSVQLPADSQRFLAARQRFVESLRKAGLPE